MIDGKDVVLELDDNELSWKERQREGKVPSRFD